MPGVEEYRAAMCVDPGASAPDTSISDSVLLDRFVGDSDRRAIELLLTRHADAAYRIALWQVGNPTDAEDIVQAAFVDVLSSAKPGIVNVRGWIMRVVINTAQDKLREEQRRRVRQQTVADHKLAHAPAAEDRGEIVQASIRAAKGLPEHYRLPIVLHYLEGCSISEVSAVLAVPEKTVRSQIARGLEQVRGALQAAGFSLSVTGILELLAAQASITAPATLTTAIKSMSVKAALPSTAGEVGLNVACKAGISGVAKVAMAAVIAAGCLTAIAVYQNNGAGRQKTGAEAERPNVPEPAPAAEPIDEALGRILGAKVSVDYRRVYYPEILADLEQRVGLKSAYPRSLGSPQLFTFSQQDGRVQDVLDKLKREAGVSVEYHGRTVVIFKAAEEKLFASLESKLRTGSAAERAEAACELGALADKRAGLLLLSALKDKDATLKMWATFSLASFASVLPFICSETELKEFAETLLKDVPAEGEYRMAFNSLLGVVPQPAAEKLLIESAQNESAGMRQSAAEALIHYSSPEALHALASCLDDIWAYNGLTRRARDLPLEALFAYMQKKDLECDKATLMAGLATQVLFPGLEQMLKSDNKFALSNVPIVLAHVRGAERDKAYEWYVSLLKHQNQIVRRSAAYELRHACQPESAKLLMQMYDEEKDPEVKQWVFSAMAHLRTDAASDWVMKHLSDFTPKLENSAAIRAVGQTRDIRAEAYYLRLMKSAAVELVPYILDGLTEGRLPCLTAELLKATEHGHTGIRWMGAVGLAHHRQPGGIDPMIRFLNERGEDWMPRCAAGVLRWYYGEAKLKDREKIVKALEEYEGRLHPKRGAPAGDF